MAATPSVRVVKEMLYRGTTQRWSNRYHFDGGAPASGADWKTLMDNIVAAEKLALGTNITIVSAVGYVAGSTIGAHTEVYTTAGTLATGTAQQAPGDVAALLRFATAATTSKGHPVYLFNYFHGVRIDTATPDTLLAAQKTALQTYGTAWITGFTDGTNVHHRAGPNGAVATARVVNTLLTHRDFPR